VLAICAFGSGVMETAKEKHFILNKDIKAILMVV